MKLLIKRFFIVAVLVSIGWFFVGCGQQDSGTPPPAGLNPNEPPHANSDIGNPSSGTPDNSVASPDEGGSPGSEGSPDATDAPDGTDTPGDSGDSDAPAGSDAQPGSGE